MSLIRKCKSSCSSSLLPSSSEEVSEIDNFGILYWILWNLINSFYRYPTSNRNCCSGLRIRIRKWTSNPNSCSGGSCSGKWAHCYAASLSWTDANSSCRCPSHRNSSPVSVRPGSEWNSTESRRLWMTLHHLLWTLLCELFRLHVFV